MQANLCVATHIELILMVLAEFAMPRKLGQDKLEVFNQKGAGWGRVLLALELEKVIKSE